MRKLFTFVVLIVSAFIVNADEYRFVINSGHNGPSTYLYFHQETQYYISVSDQGELLLLAPDEQRVVKRIQMTQAKILDLKFNSGTTEMAFVSYSDLNFFLEVWDWHRGVLLYSISLSDRPLFMEYTMGGNYLCIGQSEMPTVLWLDHLTGDLSDRTPTLSQLFQDVYVGASESNIMGYDLSGRFRYYNADDGRLIGEVPTMASLREIEVLQTGNKTITLGLTDQSFHLLDRQSGALLDSLDQSNIICYNIDAYRGLLSSIEEDRGNYYLSSYTLSEGSFLETNERALLGKELDISSLQDMGSLMLLGTNNGDFMFFDRSTQELHPFFMEDILTINGIAGDQNRLHIATEAGLISIESPYFNRNGSFDDFQRIRQYNQPYPHRGNYQLFSFNHGNYIASIDSDQPSPLLHLNEEELLERIPSLAEDSISLNSLDFLGNSMAYLGNNTDIHIYDMEDGEEVYQWANPAVKSILLLNEEAILVGKGSSPDNPGSLLMINYQTEEISPLNDSFFYILDIQRADNSTVYTLGLVSDEDGIATVLMSIDSDNQLEKILSIPLESYDSRLYFLDDELYITVGEQGLIRYDGRRSQHLLQGHEILDITLVNDRLVLLLEDSTLVFLDNSDKIDLSQNFFTDLSWLAVENNNQAYFYTQGARDNFFVYRVIRR